MRLILRYYFFVIFILSACSTASINDQKTDDALFSKSAALMQSSKWTDRVSAVEILSGQINSRSESVIITASEDQHTRVRIEAATALSFFSSKTTLNVLHKMALDDTDTDVRLISLKGLLVRHEADSAAVFIKAFAEKDWLLRETAVLGFCKIDDRSVQVKYVRNIADMIDDPSENVRSAILLHYSVQDIQIYQFIKKSILNESIIYRPSYLKALLFALQKYKMDAQTRLRVSSFMTHANPDIRVMALHCINSSDSRE
jgi:hypothetical protein